MKIDIKIMDAFWHLYENDGKKNIFGLYGGRGSGKSYAMGDLIAYKGTFERHRILCCREIQKSIAESSKKVVENRIEKMGLAKFWEFGRSYTRCKLSGSEIIYEGLKFNTEKIKSMEDITITWSEESENLTEESITLLEPTVLRAKGSRLYYTFNPKNIHDPIYQKYVLSRSELSDFRLVNWDSNKYFPESMDELRRQCQTNNPELYDWVWEGKPLGDDVMSLITALMISDAKNAPQIVDESLAINASLDVSGLGADWSVLIRRRGKQILSVDRMHKGRTEDVAEWAKGIYFEKQFDRLIVDKAGSTGVFDYLSRWADRPNQPEVIGFNGGERATRPELYGNKRAQSWVSLRDWLLNGGKLTQDSYWDIAPMQLYKYTTKQQIMLLPKDGLPKSPDELDSLAMNTLLADEKPIKSIVEPVFSNAFAHTWAG